MVSLRAPARREALPDPAVDAMIARVPQRTRASRRARSTTTRSSTAASSRSSTKARASSRKGSRSAPRTSTSSISPATDFRAQRGGPMLYADTLGLFDVAPPLAPVGVDADRRRGVLHARAADRAAGRRGRNVQRMRFERLTDAVIVSTARTGLAKSWRGAFNMTHGATLGGSRCLARHVACEAGTRRGRRRGHGLRASGGRDRMEHRPTDRAARRLPGDACRGSRVNRFCSSGLQTIAMAAQRVLAGEADAIVAGGVESISCVQNEMNQHMRRDGWLDEHKPADLRHDAADGGNRGESLRHLARAPGRVRRAEPAARCRRTGRRPVRRRDRADDGARWGSPTRRRRASRRAR